MFRSGKEEKVRHRSCNLMHVSSNMLKRRKEGLICGVFGAVVIRGIEEFYVGSDFGGI